MSSVTDQAASANGSIMDALGFRTILPPPDRVPIICPVCYERDLETRPPAHPGCRPYHLISKHLPPPSVDLTTPATRDYIGSCVVPTTWVALPLLKVTQYVFSILIIFGRRIHRLDKLMWMDRYNHDASLFEFGLPDPYKPLGLSMCKCVE
jgi:hypothetical protein